MLIKMINNNNFCIPGNQSGFRLWVWQVVYKKRFKCVWLELHWCREIELFIKSPHLLWDPKSFSLKFSSMKCLLLGKSFKSLPKLCHAFYFLLSTNDQIVNILEFVSNTQSLQHIFLKKNPNHLGVLVMVQLRLLQRHGVDPWPSTVG